MTGKRPVPVVEHDLLLGRIGIAMGHYPLQELYNPTPIRESVDELLSATASPDLRHRAIE
jgi:hypothetical protein